MTTEPRAWGGATYRGFSGPPAAGHPAPTSRDGARRRRTWPIPRPVAIGVAGALALGLIGGMWAKPDLIRPKPSAPMRAVSPEDATPAKVAIELNALPPPQTVKPATRLDVLPPDLARSAPRPLPVSDPEGAAPAVALDPCAAAGGGAAHMVCADPDLAAADRELDRAYRRALRAGASPEQLRTEQGDWLYIREQAARRSPRAVASLYEQRIDELNRIADDGDPD